MCRSPPPASSDHVFIISFHLNANYNGIYYDRDKTQRDREYCRINDVMKECVSVGGQIFILICLAQFIHCYYLAAQATNNGTQ